MDYQEMYRARLMSPEEACLLVRSGDSIVLPMVHGVPQAFLEALSRREDLEKVTIMGALDLHRLNVYKPEVTGGRIRMDSLFLGSVLRETVATGKTSYSPMRLGQVAQIARTHRCFDIAAASVSPMDRHGWFSLGTNPDYIYSIIHTGQPRCCVVEVNRHMPRTLGETMIHISQVTAVIEHDTPLVEIAPAEPTREDYQMAAIIADMVEDGSCLQLGIGTLPSLIGRFLENKKDLGVHSEMLSDTFVDLYEKGAITGRFKSFKPGRWVGTFALGTRKLYDFIDDNPLIEMLPSEVVNDPSIIGLNDKVVSVNAALEIDLTGQCCSESIGPVQYTGTGGQLDFVQGAWRSRGGKSFITLHSTYTGADGKLHSKIVPCLSQGAVVTTPRVDVQYVVTEYGLAELKGQPLHERARRLIAIAHPDFRDELRFAAKKMHLMD